MMTNGAAVKALREAMGWRGVRFAEAAQISPQYLSNIEKGHRQATPEVRRRIADALGVPLSAIVYTGSAGELHECTRCKVSVA